MTEEVIPEVAKEFDADPKRVAIGGILMGGYGAFDIARVNRGRFCASAGTLRRSGSRWARQRREPSTTPRISRHTTWWPPRKRRPTVPVPAPWVDAGEEDPFQPGIQAFTAALEAAGADLTAKTWPGGHTGDCWRSHWDDYMRFYTRALARC